MNVHIKNTCEHVQNMRNQYQNKTTINNYDEKVSKLSKQQIEDILAEAEFRLF